MKTITAVKRWVDCTLQEKQCAVTTIYMLYWKYGVVYQMSGHEEMKNVEKIFLYTVQRFINTHILHMTLTQFTKRFIQTLL